MAGEAPPAHASRGARPGCQGVLASSMYCKCIDADCPCPPHLGTSSAAKISSQVKLAQVRHPQASGTRAARLKGFSAMGSAATRGQEYQSTCSALWQHASELYQQKAVRSSRRSAC